MDVKTQVIPFKQGTYQLYVGIGEPKMLKSILKVDYHKDTLGQNDPDNGYQRPASPGRVSEIADFRRRTPLEPFPTALFLSCREKVDYDEKTGEITFNNDTPVYIVDGNHRFEGTEKAMVLPKGGDSGISELIGNTPLPFVLVENISKEKEMELFVKINGTAKSVDTALCLQILSDQNIGKPLSALDEDYLAKTIIIQVVNKLTSTAGSPWTNQIVLLSGKYSTTKEEKAAKRAMVAKATSFVESLATVYRYLEFTKVFSLSQTQDIQVTMLQNIVTDYWNAVKSVNPDLFKSPLDYAIQRSTGQYAMHMLLTDILDALGSERNWTMANFKTQLEQYALLKDTEFWRNDSNGKAGIMVGSGSKAYRALYSMLVDSNPTAKAVKAAEFEALQKQREADMN